MLFGLMLKLSLCKTKKFAFDKVDSKIYSNITNLVTPPCKSNQSIEPPHMLFFLGLSLVRCIDQPVNLTSGGSMGVRAIPFYIWITKQMFVCE